MAITPKVIDKNEYIKLAQASVEPEWVQVNVETDPARAKVEDVISKLLDKVKTPVNPIKRVVQGHVRSFFNPDEKKYDDESSSYDDNLALIVQLAKESQKQYGVNLAVLAALERFKKKLKADSELHSFLDSKIKGVKKKIDKWGVDASYQAHLIATNKDLFEGKNKAEDRKEVLSAIQNQLAVIESKKAEAKRLEEAKQKAEAERLAKIAAEEKERRVRAEAAKREAEERKAQAAKEAKEAKELKKKQNDAATVIQAGYKGHKVRSRQKARQDAAKTIQQAVRGRSARLEKEKAERDDAAATNIQRVVRGHAVRSKQEKIKRENDAATEIQRIARGKLARDRVDAIRADRATPSFYQRFIQPVINFTAVVGATIGRGFSNAGIFIGRNVSSAAAVAGRGAAYAASVVASGVGAIYQSIQNFSAERAAASITGKKASLEDSSDTFERMLKSFKTDRKSAKSKGKAKGSRIKINNLKRSFSDYAKTCESLLLSLRNISNKTEDQAKLLASVESDYEKVKRNYCEAVFQSVKDRVSEIKSLSPLENPDKRYDSIKLAIADLESLPRVMNAAEQAEAKKITDQLQGEILSFVSNNPGYKDEEDFKAFVNRGKVAKPSSSNAGTRPSINPDSTPPTQKQQTTAAPGFLQSAFDYLSGRTARRKKVTGSVSTPVSSSAERFTDNPLVSKRGELGDGSDSAPVKSDPVTVTDPESGEFSVFNPIKRGKHSRGRSHKAESRRKGRPKSAEEVGQARVDDPDPAVEGMNPMYDGKPAKKADTPKKTQGVEVDPKTGEFAVTNPIGSNSRAKSPAASPRRAARPKGMDEVDSPTIGVDDKTVFQGGNPMYTAEDPKKDKRPPEPEQSYVDGGLIGNPMYSGEVARAKEHNSKVKGKADHHTAAMHRALESFSASQHHQTKEVSLRDPDETLEKELGAEAPDNAGEEPEKPKHSSVAQRFMSLFSKPKVTDDKEDDEFVVARTKVDGKEKSFEYRGNPMYKKEHGDKPKPKKH